MQPPIFTGVKSRVVNAEGAENTTAKPFFSIKITLTFTLDELQSATHTYVFGTTIC